MEEWLNEPPKGAAMVDLDRGAFEPMLVQVARWGPPVVFSKDRFGRSACDGQMEAGVRRSILWPDHDLSSSPAA
jgi:hypothetical protein